MWSPSKLDDWRKFLYFDDGKRTIDFIVAWSTDNRNVVDLTQTTTARAKFRNALLKEGIELEEDIQTNDKFEVHYLKVHVPWTLMCSLAEDLKLRANLQLVVDKPKKKVFDVLTSVFKVKAPSPPSNYITCPFRKDCLQNYLGYKNKEKFFSPVQRQQAAYQVLATTPYGDPEMGQVGVERLIEEGIFSAVYPLNEGPYTCTKEELKTPENLSRRQVLYRFWARWGCWTRHQPLDHIRDYYGEKIGLYFAWLGCYTETLFPVAVFGFACFLYGAFTTSTFVPAKEACDSSHPIKMCPLCEEGNDCEYWHMHNFCFYFMAAYLFDNLGSVLFSVGMVIWSVVFMEVWKRRCAKLAHRWNVFDYEQEEEETRPQFVSLCTDFQQNPVTGRVQPSFSRSVRIRRMCIGIIISLLLLILVIIFLVAIITYRILVEIPMYRDPSVKSQAKMFASITGCVMNLTLIMTLGKIYNILAFKMTEWEMHETQTDFDKYLSIKVFLFQFVNYYASVFYVAFFKGRFNGHPGNFATFLGLPNESCAAGGCLMELAQQLFVSMVGILFFNNCQEILLPIVISWAHRRHMGWKSQQNTDKTTVDVVPKQYIEDYKLIQYEGLFGEYLELVILFGFISIFAAAFPLGPLFALCNNWLEIRIDAQKLVCSTRRPVPQRAKSIGIWFQFTEFIVAISIITNAFIIAFTSNFLDYILYAIEIHPNLEGSIRFFLVAAKNGTTEEPCMVFVVLYFHHFFSLGMERFNFGFLQGRQNAYRDYKNADGEYTPFYWRLIVLRLIFVIVFEHVVFMASRLLDFVIPDIPRTLDTALRRERFLAKRAKMSISEMQITHQD